MSFFHVDVISLLFSGGYGGPFSQCGSHFLGFSPPMIFLRTLMRRGMGIGAMWKGTVWVWV